MANDITILAEEIQKLEKPTEEELHFLRALCVQLRHEVPPQHQVENRAGSRPLTREESEEFSKYAPIIRGAYSPEEDETIVGNWKEFCKMHNWNPKKPKPFLLLRESTTMTYIRSKKERRRFVQFLADGLPNRTLFSVYHRFRTLHQKHNLRRYKPEEDRMILHHIEENPNLDEKRKFTDLAKVLKRTRNSVWKRYRILRNKRLIKEEEGTS